MGQVWSLFYRRQRLLTVLGFFLLASALFYAAVIFVDDRTVDGTNVWVKPAKFSLSLGVYFLTLAFFLPWLKTRATSRGWYKASIAILILAVIYEYVWLLSASIVGVRSHFHFEGGIFSILYPIAGIAAVGLLVPALTFGISILRARDEAGNRTLAESVGWGLILTFVLTMTSAPALSSGLFGGSLNGYGDGFFGWRIPGGDLRAAHFFATHAAQAIPIAGFVISRVSSGVAGIWLVRILALAYAAGVVWLLLGSLTGQDLPAILTQPF